MTRFASTATFIRAGKTLYHKPRLEIPETATQARKSSARHWRNAMKPDDTLSRVFLVSVAGEIATIHERLDAEGRWLVINVPVAEVAVGHLLDAVKALGGKAKQPPMPEVLVINGFKYRREL